MRRRAASPRFRPLLKSAGMAIAPSIDDEPGSQDFRALLVRIPDRWEFRGVDRQRYTGEIETVLIKNRDPDGIPAGRYLRLAVDQLIDPWGHVAVGMEFDTPAGPQRAELTLDTRDDAMAAVPSPGASQGIQLDASSVLELGGDQSVIFIDGDAGDSLDLSDHSAGRWASGDSDGTRTLYIRTDSAGRRTAALAVRNGVAVKLA
jgi:hypothetical protein